MLRWAQPDLINPVRCLTRLNADRVFSAVLQYNGNGVICITCPAIDASGVDIQPIPHPNTSGAGSDLIIHLQPDRICVAAVDIGFTS